MNRIPICERLRELGGEDRPISHQMPTCTEAAKLIESLVEALKPFAEHPDFQAPDDWAITIVNSYERTPGLTVGDLRRAREALSQAHTEVILDEGK